MRGMEDFEKAQEELKKSVYSLNWAHKHESLGQDRLIKVIN